MEVVEDNQAVYEKQSSLVEKSLLVATATTAGSDSPAKPTDAAMEPAEDGFSGVVEDGWYLSHVMRKPVYVICEQQRRRSACASAQSDQHLCCLLPG